jgi:hypothetical protein
MRVTTSFAASQAARVRLELGSILLTYSEFVFVQRSAAEPPSNVSQDQLILVQNVVGVTEPQ